MQICFCAYSGCKNLIQLMNNFKVKLRIPGLFCVLTVCISLIWACDSEENVQPEPADITVGAILSLDGQWSTLGRNSEAALDIAVSEINEYYQSNGFNAELSVRIYDSGLDPDVALQHLKTAVSDDIKVIIGPQSSAELAALKPFADENGVLVISTASTAGSLSLPGDYIYRFCPDGTLEGQALAKKIYEDGVRALVTVSRDDVGNKGLETDLVAAFESLGGTVHSLDSYSADISDFSTVIEGIESNLTGTISTFGADATGVYIAAFDEGVSLFGQAVDNPTLSSVNWYGGDGLVSSEALIQDDAASEFAVETNFIAPNFALPESARTTWQPLLEEIESRTGLSVSAFALAAYDALWVTAMTYESRSQQVIPPFSVVDFSGAFRNEADKHSGATGPTQLNGNGDRSVASFGFWGVVKMDNVYQWNLDSTSE